MFKYIATAFVAVFVCGCSMFTVGEEDVTIKVRTDKPMKYRELKAKVSLKNNKPAEIEYKK